MSDYNVEYISFRKEVREIPSTTFGCFGLYKYPAKFIPHVVYYILNKYSHPDYVIFDPFAGFGTTGFVSRLFGNFYILWELNPLIRVFFDTVDKVDLDKDENKVLDLVKNSNFVYIPNWKNIDYWYPEEFLSILSKAWGFVHNTDEKNRFLLIVPLLKLTKYFSYFDDKIFKAYKSKYSKEKVKILLNKDYKSIFYEKLFSEIVYLKNKIIEYKRMNPKGYLGIVNYGISSYQEVLDRDVNILITSPPYLQAQEYIRSTKMELFWLGFDENYIRKLSSKEIPYCKVESLYNINSDTFYDIRNKIMEQSLLCMYDNYFSSVLNIFDNLSKRVMDYLFIFVGRARVRNTEVPIDIIIKEHMESLGWKHVITYIDEIVSRNLFRNVVNPSTGLASVRMKYEYLLVMKRH